MIPYNAIYFQYVTMYWQGGTSMDATSVLRSAARAGSAPGQKLRESMERISSPPKSEVIWRILLSSGKFRLVSYFDSVI